MMNLSQSGKEDLFENCSVTPIQVALIVDRYLCDNNFAETRTTFRKEASFLLSSLEVPKGFLSLREILNACMKIQKMTLDQEMILTEQQNNRTRMLPQTIENVMNTSDFDASRSLIRPIRVPQDEKALPGVLTTTTTTKQTTPNILSVMPQSFNTNENFSTLGMRGCPATLSNIHKPLVPQSIDTNVENSSFSTLVMTSHHATMLPNISNMLSLPIKTNEYNRNLSTPMISIFDKKRKDIIVEGVPLIVKKSRGRPPKRKLSTQGIVEGAPLIVKKPRGRPPKRKLSTQGIVEGAPLIVKKPRGRPPKSKLSTQGQSTLPQSNNQILLRHSSTTQSISGNCVLSRAQPEGSIVAQCLFNQPLASGLANSTKSVMVSHVDTNSDNKSKGDHERRKLDANAQVTTESMDTLLPNKISTSLEEKFDLSIIDLSDFDGLEFPDNEVMYQPDKNTVEFSLSDMFNDEGFLLNDIRSSHE